LLALTMLLLFQSSVFGQTSTVTDIDGNIYNTKVYGNMEWMTENLRVTHLNNGDSIRGIVCNIASWRNDSIGLYPAFCDYNNDAANGTLYGHLYNWSAVTSKKKTCPIGWHVPDTATWIALTKAIMGSNWQWGSSAEKANTILSVGIHMKSTNGWKTTDSTSTSNNSGFNALPSGYRYWNADFTLNGESALWWTPNYVQIDSIGQGRQHVELDFSSNDLLFSGNHQYNAKSVRCMRFIQTGIELNETADAWKIYPNPASDFVTISSNGNSSKQLSIEMYNDLGMLFLKQDIPDNQAINIQNLPASLYYVKLYNEQGIIQVLKFLKP